MLAFMSNFIKDEAKNAKVFPAFANYNDSVCKSHYSNLGKKPEIICAVCTHTCVIISGSMPCVWNTIRQKILIVTNLINLNVICLVNS